MAYSVTFTAPCTYNPIKLASWNTKKMWRFQIEYSNLGTLWILLLGQGANHSTSIEPLLQC
jgi:hypothetical protein